MEPPLAAAPADRKAYEPLLAGSVSANASVLIVLQIDKELLFKPADLNPVTSDDAKLHQLKILQLTTGESMPLVLECADIEYAAGMRRRIETAKPYLREDAFIIYVGRALGSKLLENNPITIHKITLVAPEEILVKKAWPQTAVSLKRVDALVRLIGLASQRAETDSQKFGHELCFHQSGVWHTDDLDTPVNRTTGFDKFSHAAIAALEGFGTLPPTARWLAFFFPSVRTLSRLPALYRFAHFLRFASAGAELCHFAVTCAAHPPSHLLRTVGSILLDFGSSFGSESCVQRLAAYGTTQAGAAVVFTARRFVMWELMARQSNWSQHFDVKSATVKAVGDSFLTDNRLIATAHLPLQRNVCCVCKETTVSSHTCFAPGEVATPPPLTASVLPSATKSTFLGSLWGAAGKLFTGSSESDFAIAYREQLQKANTELGLNLLGLDKWWDGWDRDNNRKAAELMCSEVKDMLIATAKSMKTLAFSVALFAVLRLNRYSPLRACVFARKSLTVAQSYRLDAWRAAALSAQGELSGGEGRDVEPLHLAARSAVHCTARSTRCA